MTIDQANEIWEACYGTTNGDGWNRYTWAERMEAIDVRSGGTQPLYDPELARIEQRQWERDGWNLQRATRQRF